MRQMQEVNELNRLMNDDEAHSINALGSAVVHGF
jgi:hypothetical protein